MVTLASGTLVRRVGTGLGSGGGGILGTDMSHKHSSEFEELQNIKISPAVLSCNINVDTTVDEQCQFFFFFLNFCVQSGSERVRTGSGRPDSWPSQIFTWQESAVGSVNSSASTTARQTPGFSIASCFIDKRNSGKKQSVNSFL